MENFNLKKFLVENKLTTNSNLTEESTEVKEVTEAKIKIKTYRGLPDDPVGYVDTNLIDQLVAQIGPHIGYTDWENRLNLTEKDYQDIIQKIAKHMVGAGTLQGNRIEFI